MLLHFFKLLNLGLLIKQTFLIYLLEIINNNY